MTMEAIHKRCYEAGRERFIRENAARIEARISKLGSAPLPLTDIDDLHRQAVSDCVATSAAERRLERHQLMWALGADSRDEFETLMEWDRQRIQSALFV